MTPPADGSPEEDQDSEPTMMAPVEGRPDGIDPSVAETQSDTTSQDADDQSGAEDAEAP
ncbi:MAG TPA: hypothetical protein VF642_06345 [Propionibacteriaceae bacterium]|jgi:hypothetical protein